MSLRLLKKYWYRLTMVERSGLYYGFPFKWYWGVTQIDTLLLKTFNMVIYVVFDVGS